MDPKRELKLAKKSFWDAQKSQKSFWDAQKSFWDGKSRARHLQKVAADIRVAKGPDVKFSYASHTGVAEYKEAKALGVDTVPVLVTAFGFDLVLGTKTLDLIKGDFPEGKYLFAGVVDGRNIWANDLAASWSTLETLEGIVGKDKLVVSTSCSLLHTAVDLVNETKLDKEIKPWLVFAVQKVVEVNALARTLAGQKVEVIFYANAAAQASRKSSPRGQRCGGPKLFDIEETKGDRDLIDNTEDEIGISPPAISRSPIPKTMRVKIMVNGREYIALIDTGSNLNFLQPWVAREMGLQIIEDDPIEVSIADGSKMYSEGSCPEFKFVIQGVQFATQAYILQLGEFDVILGIQWLMGLGQIKNWDFASLKMELTQGDRTIQIKGMDTEESEAGCSTDEKLVSMFREGVKYGAGIGPGVFDIHSPRVPSTEEIKYGAGIGPGVFDGVFDIFDGVFDIHSPRVPSTEEIKYGAGIGPGVFDIHSPRLPSTEEIADGTNKMLAVLKTIQVNPDGGLKTRKYTEVKPALKNKLLRSQLVSAK